MARFWHKKAIEIAIDIGSHRTRVFSRESGLLCDSPTALAIDKSNSGKIYIGQEALESGYEITRPLKPGSKDNMKLEVFTRKLLEVSLPTISTTNIDLIPSISTTLKTEDRIPIRDILSNIYKKNIFFIETIIASAYGAKIYSDPNEEITMLVHIGASRTEIAILSMGAIVEYNSILTAGNFLDNAILSHIRDKEGLIIMPEIAEKIKIEHSNEMLKTLIPDTELGVIKVIGRDVTSKQQREISIEQEVITMALTEPIKKISQAINNTLEIAPENISKEISKKGIIITGGSAELTNMDVILSNQLQLPVIKADEPSLCPTMGLFTANSKIMHNSDDRMYG